MNKPVTVTFEVNEKKAGQSYLEIRRGRVEMIFYVTQKEMNEYSKEVLKAKGHGVSK